ncbi:hypothetical protein D9611_010677 [Ephemerocybe angulata]|uniref:Uncharacterized protein n=1 Tax=Ephemerocybe angulata TaxID=980116 RepID=A0A8H5BBR9_9AGAR|nr:hypothetical protein D9611_010677 [Tulosesus angulatus]
MEAPLARAESRLCTADRYLEYVPRVSSPLTLPPVSSELDTGREAWRILSSLGLDTVQRFPRSGEEGRLKHQGEGIKKRKGHKRSASSFGGFFSRKETTDAQIWESIDTKRHAAYSYHEQDRRPQGEAFLRRPLLDDDPALESYPGQMDRESRRRRRPVGPDGASSSQVTLAQLLADELEQMRRGEFPYSLPEYEYSVEEDTDAEVADVSLVELEDTEPPLVSQSDVRGRLGRRLSYGFMGRHSRSDERSRLLESLDSDMQAGCLHRCRGRSIRRWTFRMKPKSQRDISPALQALVERPMSPEEYHAYFLNLYIHEGSSTEAIMEEKV